MLHLSFRKAKKSQLKLFELCDDFNNAAFFKMDTPISIIIIRNTAGYKIPLNNSIKFITGINLINGQGDANFHSCIKTEEEKSETWQRFRKYVSL